ncbi:MAG TPA: transporter substrate-binding domain-containing protein [Desulfomonilaceae bacterium]|nr:transporter substrate-binding domain-containing protein [Desulfomonilaceae bacterium]
MEEQQYLPSITTRRSFRGVFMVVLIGFLITAAHIPPCGLHEASASGQKPLLFLGNKDYPPLVYLDDSIAKGVEVDLAKALAKAMGRTIQIELMDWPLAQEKVLRGEADALLLMGMSKEGMRLFDFSPTFTHEFVLFVRSSHFFEQLYTSFAPPEIRGPSDLTGKTIGVLRGGILIEMLQTKHGVNIVPVEDYKDGLDRLVSGSIDVMAADRWVAAYIIQAHGIRGVTIAGGPFALAQSGFAVKKGNVTLLNEINLGIERLREDGTMSEIHRKWRPEEILFLQRERVRIIAELTVGVFLIILLGIMALWVITLKKQIRVRKRVEDALRQQSELLRDLSARLLEVEETERKRLAGELHDLVGRNLTALCINLTAILNAMPAVILQPAYSRLNESLVMVQDTMASIRDVILELRPSMLDDFGLTAAIRWYGELFSRRTGLTITMHVEDIVPRLPAQIENNLFRIFQEALTNVFKHANASEVTVSIEEDNSNVRMTINDNGIGFDTSCGVTTPRSKGWGLLMMTERAVAAGASFSIESRPGKGTRISMEVKR